MSVVKVNIIFIFLLFLTVFLFILFPYLLVLFLSLNFPLIWLQGQHLSNIRRTINVTQQLDRVDIEKKTREEPGLRISIKITTMIKLILPRSFWFTPMADISLYLILSFIFSWFQTNLSSGRTQKHDETYYITVMRCVFCLFCLISISVAVRRNFGWNTL